MIEGITLEAVCEETRKLPCAPDLLPKILDAVRKTNAPVSLLADLVAKDPGTSAAVLRLANSAFFSRNKCESLHEAFLRLGQSEVLKLVSGGILGRWLSTDVDAYGWRPGDLCTHSFTVALAAEQLSRRGGSVNPETAYTAGLLHDIGKLGMAFACGKHFEQVRKLQEHHPEMSWRLLEREVFSFDHTEVGAMVLAKWNYPTSLVQVVRFYPRPAAVTDENSQALVAVVHAAKNLAISLGFGVGEDGFRNELDEEILIKYGYTPELCESVVPTVVEELQKISDPTGQITFK
jgi:putative nucleotidyltransferase with HDIG domain